MIENGIKNKRDNNLYTILVIVRRFKKQFHKHYIKNTFFLSNKNGTDSDIKI